MQLDLEYAAETTARHQRDMAEHQRLMAEEQRLSNLRNTILATLPLLKEEEKAQYLMEQLLPRIKGIGKTRTGFASLPLSKIFEDSGLIQFASDYSKTNPTAEEFFVTGKPLIEEKLRQRVIQTDYINKKVEYGAIEDEKDEFSPGCLSSIILLFAFAGAFILILITEKCFLTEETLNQHDRLIFWTNIIFPFIATSLIYGIMEEKFKKIMRKNNARPMIVMLLGLRVIQLKIESFANIEEILKAQDALWEDIKANFIDTYLASAAGKEFTGEQGGYKMLLTMSSPWREVVAEEQAFLPPSVRLPFVECWLPLLLKEDDLLEAAFVVLKNFQAQLKTFLLELVEPDYENQIIAMKRWLLSESFYNVISKRKYLSSDS
jgi:hypothetical protein